jgi:hypothetical protein
MDSQAERDRNVAANREKLRAISDDLARQMPGVKATIKRRILVKRRKPTAAETEEKNRAKTMNAKQDPDWKHHVRVDQAARRKASGRASAPPARHADYEAFSDAASSDEDPG